MTNTVKPSRQEMINTIYEKIARKDLSFGCKCWINEPDMPGKMTHIGTVKIETLFQKKYIEAFWCEADKKIIYENYKIIGHPVMIGDVMDYFDFKIYNHGSYGYEMNRNLHDISWFWQEKRNPIEEQSEECIAFVYNLITE